MNLPPLPDPAGPDVGWYTVDQMITYAMQVIGICTAMCDAEADRCWDAWDKQADPTDQGRALAAEWLASEMRKVSE